MNSGVRPPGQVRNPYCAPPGPCPAAGGRIALPAEGLFAWPAAGNGLQYSTNDSPKPCSVSKVPGNEVTLHEHCYGMSMVHPDQGPPSVHTYRGFPGTACFRVSNHEGVVTLVSYRTMAEQGLYCRKQGIGRSSTAGVSTWPARWP